MQELGLAALAELVARQRLLLLFEVAPQLEVAQEVRALLGEAAVALVGLALAGRRAARAGPGSTVPRR
jgi:hypothetical protein